MNPPVVFHLLALLPLLAFGYVTWRLICHRERVAAAIAGLVVVALIGLHPLVQIAADSLIARPYAEKKKSLADGADIVGKDFAFAVSRLGEPKRIRVENPTIVTTATRTITKKLEPYTALDYYPTSAIYMGTRFIVFLNSAGIVTSYRVKWEKKAEDNSEGSAAPQRAAGPRLNKPVSEKE